MSKHKPQDTEQNKSQNSNEHPKHAGKGVNPQGGKPEHKSGNPEQQGTHAGKPQGGNQIRGQDTNLQHSGQNPKQQPGGHGQPNKPKTTGTR